METKPKFALGKPRTEGAHSCLKDASPSSVGGNQDRVGLLRDGNQAGRGSVLVRNLQRGQRRKTGRIAGGSMEGHFGSYLMNQLMDEWLLCEENA